MDAAGKKRREYQASVRAAYSAGNISEAEILNIQKKNPDLRIDIDDLKPIGGKEVYHLSVSSSDVENGGFLTKDELLKKGGKEGLGGGRGGISLTYDKKYAETLYRIFNEIKDALNGKVNIADEFKRLGQKAQENIIDAMKSAIGGTKEDIRNAIENNKTTYKGNRDWVADLKNGGENYKQIESDNFIKHYYNALSMFSDLGDREWIALHTGVSKLKDADIGIFKGTTKKNAHGEILPAEREYHVFSGDAVENLERITPKAVEQSIKETPQSGGGVKLSSSNTLQKSVSMVLNAPIEYMKMIINSEVAAERKETDKTKKSQLRKSIQENKKVLAHLIAARKDPKFSKDAEVYRGVAIALANGQHIVAALESPVPTTFAHEAIFHSTIEPFLETDLEAKQAFIDEYNEVFEANESEWSTDVSEYTARVYEKYLSNGRKLTEADVKDKGRRATLQKAFDAFTEMMKNLYQSVISYKGKEIQLSDQARMFFDKVHGLNTQSVAETIVESSMSPVHKNIFDLMTNKKSSADITSEEVFDIFRYAKNAGIYLGENNKLTKKCN
jgi:hypothetical protein